MQVCGESPPDAWRGSVDACELVLPVLFLKLDAPGKPDKTMKEVGSDYTLAMSERPRERLLQYGAPALSLRELIAIILQHGPAKEGALGLADQIICLFDGMDGLARAPITELIKVKGVGEVKAIQLKAALELGKRLITASAGDRPKIKTPADAAQIMMPVLGTLEQEELHVMLLDARNNVIKTHCVYKGQTASVSMRTAEMFREAVRHNAVSIVVFHNHPSGDPAPSVEDVKVTKALVNTGKIMEIDLLDHIIISQARYISLKERGLGFDE